MIGLGKLHNNLYLLQALSNCKSISEVSTVLELVLQSFAHSISHIPIVTKPHLSHLRLGHVSDANFNIVYLMYLSFIQINSVLFVQLQSIKDCIFPTLITYLIMLLT